MEKIWLKSYPPGVPADIDPDAYSSIPELLIQSCQAHAKRPAFYNLGATITYGQVEQESRDFAAYLQQVLKLNKGDRFAIMLPNSLQYPVAMFGALRAGLIIVNVNPLYTASELIHQLNDADVETILVMANFAHTVEVALPQLPKLKNIIVTQLGDLLPPIKAQLVNFMLKYIHKKIPAWHLPHAINFKQALHQGRELSFVPPTLTNQDIAFLQYTGGTTGIAKGAMLTHRNIIANMQQADAWFKDFLVDSKEIIVTALPLYHIFSLTANCLYFTKLGGLNILITNPRDIAGMLKDLHKYKFTTMTGVNTLFNALLKNPDFAKLDFSDLRLTLGGGMPVQQAVAEQWQAITHTLLLEAYGLTEAAPSVAINPPNLRAFNGSVGLPVPSTDVCMLDEDGKEVPLGQAGELAIKGPQVMKGYWQHPDETKKIFTADGWLLTGDIARMDEHGILYILERKKDMILVSGFNVYPNELEDVIAKLPGVHEVAVIGVADEHSGEVPKAFIVKSAANLTAEQVIQHCHQYLASYKVPKYVEFRQVLPKSTVGKILRRELRG